MTNKNIIIGVIAVLIVVGGAPLLSQCKMPSAEQEPPAPPTLKIPLSLQATEEWLEDVNKLIEPPLNSQEILKNINTAEREFAPEISHDGLTLIFSRGEPPNESNLFVSYRSSLNEPFGSPQKINISGVSSNWYEGAALSPDQRSLYFDAFNPQGKTKIWQSSLAGYTREETIPKDRENSG